MTLRLTPAELVEICAGLTQPRRQVDHLLSIGFWRARYVRGEAVLERAHYEAVCAGALPPGEERRDTGRPQLRPIEKAA